MFTSSGQLHLNVPRFNTRRALIILNLQNDALSLTGEPAGAKLPGFVDKIKALVPQFRKTSDIVWVRTELVSDKLVDAQLSSSDLSVEDDTSPELLRGTDQESDHVQNDTDTDEEPSQSKDLTIYLPSSRTKDSRRHASPKARAEQREADRAALQKLEPTESLLAKPIKGQGPLYFQPGTYGAAIANDVLPLVDEAQDLLIVKSHYSALDDTSLLLSLRMKLVTDLYLCGCLSNVSIYATAADAVKHGFSVTVVEDCIGYRSKANHETALRQMEDIMGAYGITSEELIAEMKGTASPDANNSSSTHSGIPDIRLQSLSLGRESPRSGGSASSPSLAKSSTEMAVANDGSLSRGKVTQFTQDVTHRKSTTAGAVILASTPSSPRVDPNIQEQDKIVPDSEGTVGVLDNGGTMAPDLKCIKPSPRLSLRGKIRMPSLGPNDIIGEGDSRIVLDILPPWLNDNAFALLRTEVQWKSMHHRSGEVPRLVAVQGEMGKDGSTPIYRHPADESPPLSPFSSLVEKIRVEVQKALDQPMNHALIQLYRNGEDNISEHSDKTLDIVRGSSIVNVSIGAQRVMTLRSKKSRQVHDTESPPAARKVQRIAMPNNSMFVLGPRTNMRWLHGVRADKRLPLEKSDEERAFGGERISITFRHIGTFMNGKHQTIWGQGARSKTQDEAAKIRNTDGAEMESMVVAFGKENHQADFDWDAEYGPGFDAIDLISKTARLFLCGDLIPDRRVQLSLIEKGVPFEIVGPKSSPGSRPLYKLNSPHAPTNTQHPRFKDTDGETSEVDGDLAILFYLEKFYPFIVPQTTAATALVFSRTTQTNGLLFLWRDVQSTGSFPDPKSEALHPSNPASSISPSARTQELKEDLEVWEDFAGDAEFIAGEHFTLTDCAFWPLLNEIVTEWEEWNEERYPDLAAYHRRLARRASARTVVGEA